MIQHLQSKTVAGLILLLSVFLVLVFTGRLTHDSLEGIKWFGISYFGVRGVANASEVFTK